LVRHIEYVTARIGIDHVASGSDFDGATMSQHLGDASGLLKLLAEIEQAG